MQAITRAVRHFVLPILGAAAGTLALATATTAQAQNPTRADMAPYSAVPAPEWDALFRRSTGWTGADGVYSLPMSGDERPGQGAAGRSFIWFSDTFVGTVRANGSRVNTTLVNNTSALLDGDQPDAARLQFNVRAQPNGAATAMVVPDSKRYPGQWFWPQDGVVLNGTVYVYALRIKPADTPPFAFASAGLSLLGARASDPVPFQGAYAQRDTPLFRPAQGDRVETNFGVAVMPVTRRAGAPAPDGYLYVYGVRNRPYSKGLVVARVPARQIEDFAAYRYWNGQAWVGNIDAAEAVAWGVSPEFSVQPLPDGRFLLVHMTDTLGRTVAARYGASPVGPWGADIPLWDCPEIGLTPNTYVYGAKAHPHLSAAGELLISYHVNTFDFAENFRAGGVEIYRPRFLRVPLP